MKIAVIGTGYVGLVSGICFARIGHEVICVDKDKSKIDKLNNGEIPIFEPGLKDNLKEINKRGNISFTTSLEKSIKDSDVIFIAVGTPQDEETGKANLDFVFSVAKDIAKYANSYKVIVTKSTVPVGTGHKIKQIIKSENNNLEFSIASNPEFLREGCAIIDFISPDRIVIGFEDDRSKKIMQQIYAPLMSLNNNQNLIIYTDIISSELIKYAANSFLATKIAFINEMADLCEQVGGDIKSVSKGIGSDSRIGDQFLNPGPGFGGSCFPKDILALNEIAKDCNVNLSIINSIINSNNDRKEQMVQRIIDLFDGDIKNKKIALLGLAFKGNTDDIRYSPAIVVAKGLLRAGAVIQAHDPEAMENSRNEIQNSNILYFDNYLDACKDVDIIVIATEWSQFKKINLSKIKTVIKNPLILDLRNLLDINKVEKEGFVYKSIGCL
jgi:UDPglucose 6-dehydrogenase